MRTTCVRQTARMLMLVICGAALTWGFGADQGQDSIRARPPRLRDAGLPGLNIKVPNLTALTAWNLDQLIQTLAHIGGIDNVVIGPGVADKTTIMMFKDVAVGDALEMVLSVNRLAYEIDGNVIKIITDEEYKARRGVSFYDNKDVKIVNLKYADPGRLSTMLASMKSDVGTVVADPLTGTLILIDTREKIAEMEAVIEKADIATVSRQLPTETRAFALQYADVEDVEPQVKSLLTPDVGTVRADKRTKTLVISDLPHAMKKIQDLLAVFDRRPKQVFIEAKIVQVGLGENYKLGVDWNHVMQAVDPRFYLQSTVQPKAMSSEGVLAPGTGVGSLTYRSVLGGGDLQFILDALKVVGETKILSNPHVACVDGQEAVIKVITDQPYAEAQIESGSTNVVGETIKFIEVGVTLQVTPRIADDGMISVAIRPEVSSVIGDYQAYRSVPIVRRSYAETSVMVKNGETIIIAGMIENNKQRSSTQVPLMGRIPLVGMLFRSDSNGIQNDETIVFMTPRIVSGEEPFLLTRDERKQPKPLRGTASDETKQMKSVR